LRAPASEATKDEWDRSSEFKHACKKWKQDYDNRTEEYNSAEELLIDKRVQGLPDRICWIMERRVSVLGGCPHEGTEDARRARTGTHTTASEWEKEMRITGLEAWKGTSIMYMTQE